MFKTSSKILWALLIVMISLPASALIDLRLTYGLQAIDPTALNNNAPTLPAITKMNGLGADIIVSPPVIPVGFGLRYEQLGSEETLPGVSVDFNMTRTALIVNWRFIDTFLMVGIIGTYGLSHSNEYKSTGGPYTATLKADDVSSLTAGVEAGVKIPLLGMIAGAEAGTMKMELKKYNQGAPDADFNGFYTKVFVGFNLL